MSGMGSTLQLTNPTVVAAFRSALTHQGIVALLIFFLLAMLWVSAREWVPGSRASPARPLSAAFGASTSGTGPAGRGSLGVLLSGGRAASVSGPGAPWRSLPALPAGASSRPDGGATLAAAPGGFEALTARGRQLSVWALSSGSSAWDRSQVINVAIPYGSSS